VINPVAKFVKYGECNIPQDDFRMLLTDYGDEEIISFLTEKIIDGSIELPMKKHTLEDAKESFNALRKYHTEISEGDVFARYDYKYPLSNRYIDCSSVGNVASDYFHQYNRWKADSLVSPSPVRTWKSEKFLHSALGGLFSLKAKSVDSNTLRMCLNLRKYIASQFKPTVAKTIYDLYKPNDVLDFCSGWGDRLCGFYASDYPETYTGVDPNSCLVESYFEQSKLYSQLIGDKRKTANMICSAAEDIASYDQNFDLILTSPPYFNIEKYCNENTQSYKRYRSIESWLNEFLFVAIYTAWKSLRKNGYMLINISDVYSGHKVQKICDPMNDFIYSIGGKYFGTIGMKMSKRPNSKASARGIFIEPIWIWRKE